MAALVAEHSERLFADLATPALLARADGGEWCREEWAQLASSGYLDALVPASHGGAGLAPADAFALARRAAYHALPLPLGETLAARALWCAAGGELAELEAPWTLGSNDASDGPQLSSTGGLRLRGTLRRLSWARHAGVAVLQAWNDAGQPCLVKVDLQGVPKEAGSSLANEARDTITLDMPIPDDAVLPLDRPAITPLPRVAGALVRAQQLAGAMQRCLDLTLQYAGERVQFGQPIGKFPAVQAMLVEAVGETAAAGAAVELACSRWDGDPAQLEFLTAVAKSRAGEAAGKVATACHQVHGAIGFTQEHVLHHFTRRLWSWRDEFGSETWWNRRLGELACSRGADALWPAVTRL
ncbi:acyl-CoA dehydrogenase family protein [Ramlibacter sp. PS3R-8]|uniref:acyl-CoA dehydrogenase family protein n=1 Tax=Ramlibacter sp. PS3R-8 TaxID=3133437 RepID=UPI0030B3A60B